MPLQSDLVATLHLWTPPDPEGAFQQAAWGALASRPDLLGREGLPAHFTASALPMAADAGQVCLVLHAKMGRWVQPGGHLEGPDRSIREAAAREMREETGLAGRIDPVPLLLSRHPAPCRPAAWHLDVQLLAVCEPTPPRASAESRRVAWFRVDDLPVDLAPGVEELVEAGNARLSRSDCPGPPPPGE